MNDLYKLVRSITGLLEVRDSVVHGADVMREYDVNTAKESDAVRDIENEIFIKKMRELISEY